MTSEEFIQNSIALIGTTIGWQSAIARRLGVNNRTIRKIVKGDLKISDGLAKDLLDLLGENAPQIIHAEWILGQGDDNREYLIHTRHPRFQCLVLDLNDPEYEFDHDAGVQYTFNNSVLCGFLWHDRKPDNIAEVLEPACEFIRLRLALKL